MADRGASESGPNGGSVPTTSLEELPQRRGFREELPQRRVEEEFPQRRGFEEEVPQRREFAQAPPLVIVEPSAPPAESGGAAEEDLGRRRIRVEEASTRGAFEESFGRMKMEDAPTREEENPVRWKPEIREETPLRLRGEEAPTVKPQGAPAVKPPGKPAEIARKPEEVPRKVEEAPKGSGVEETSQDPMQALENLPCSACKKDRPSNFFTHSQLKKGSERKCSNCVEIQEKMTSQKKVAQDNLTSVNSDDLMQALGNLPCSACKKEFPPDFFSKSQLKKGSERKCLDCVEIQEKAEKEKAEKAKSPYGNQRPQALDFPPQ